MSETHNIVVIKNHRDGTDIEWMHEKSIVIWNVEDFTEWGLAAEEIVKWNDGNHSHYTARFVAKLADDLNSEVAYLLAQKLNIRYTIEEV